MRKTVVTFDDDVYEAIVNLSVKKYGNTKNISRVVNELLRKELSRRRKVRSNRVSMKVSVRVPGAETLSPEEIDRIAEEEISDS
ncbi:hypothetical protein [Sulfolobus acidocaldarius]|uniref:Uncharacterized protein n=4 Tax=Sulfolobus acidocaldarius TaxID=2285 RepID=Q4J7A6_SULAC|nr:hypothetical protein [Sulfolobus acidocaldarius]AAY81325.1 hypothetical protein Saci_2029 [Sulfolobus acidocaldarius DSM 639]AGE71967.1 hypothetical protein SacN8_10085 [Sulfolobus acidocaldarius N8]AGE74239.1 hypothetical protein SacRon12I_10105 [Sulfolobus acidocaldarius Ron12/I]ALU29873.1 hypothetical protein ATY89_07930 [Sulfolobus acidocaldarius]ALU32613.1 hypothetical protein ATZ20_10950 [Sulfolobus acidocaldarius]